MDQVNQSHAEALHHECSPAQELDREAHFSDKLDALFRSAHKKEVPLSDCTIADLEEQGVIKEKF